MATKKTPAPRRAGNSKTAKKQRDRMHRVLVALADEPALLAAWIRDGEIRVAGGMNKQS